MLPRMVRVRENVEAFLPLVAAAKAEGVRVGWLDLEAAFVMPAELESVAAAGALRAVAVVQRRVIVVKATAGDPVLRDLVREHFTGCRLLLVHGAVEAPELTPVGDKWRLAADPTGEERELTTAGLLAALRRPRFP